MIADQATRKSEIEIDLKKNPHDERYQFIKPKKSTSEVWQNFDLIKFENKLENFARCVKCSTLVTYTTRTGTASLLRHKCYMQSYVNKYMLKSLPEARKKLIARKQLYFLLKDVPPINIMDGEGFKELSQELINIGVAYGSQNVEDILVSQKTLTEIVIPEEYDFIKTQLRNLIESNSVSFTSDLWTNEDGKRSFLTLTGHFVDDNFTLKKYILGTREFVHGNCVNDIRNCVLDVLKDYEAKEKLTNSFFVTDSNANSVLAFRPYRRIFCACHSLNLTMQDVFESNDIPELNSIVNASKQLVAFLALSDLNNKLSKSLKLSPSTSWDSIYMMLASICDIFMEIETVLSQNEIHVLEGLKFGALNSLVAFLTLFKECSRCLSSHSKPTINDYVLWKLKLSKHCDPQPDDSDIMKKIKKTTATALHKRFQTNDLHYVALFLSPKFKSLKFLSASTRSETLSSVLEMLKVIKDENKKFDCNGVQSKKRKLNDPEWLGSFDDFQDSSSEEEIDDMRLELENYKKKTVRNVEDVLKFWKEQMDIPLLRELAKQVLGVPASSATNEQVFSTDASLFEIKRNKLVLEDVDKLLFLHQNVQIS